MPDTPYMIQAPEEYWLALAELDDGHQERVLRFLRDQAQHHPRQPIPQSLKQLRGRYRGYWQFVVSVSTGWRLIYRVDDQNHVVVIEYLGAHPNWGRIRRGARL